MNGYISIFVAVVVITILIYVLMKQTESKSKRRFDPGKMRGNSAESSTNSSSRSVNEQLVKSKWVEISAMQNGGPASLKNALSEADKLLDYVMIQKGFRGETMGDRLKSGGSAFSNLNAIWGAHKLRNQLAHEVEHDMVAEQVKHAITVLGQGIRDLGVSL